MASKKRKRARGETYAEQMRRIRKEGRYDASYLEERAGRGEYSRSHKSLKSRGLSGTPSEHLQAASYGLSRLTRDRVERMTCGEVGMALFDVGRIIAQASSADDGSATGRKLFAMAAARRDQVFAKAAACGMRGPVRS